MKNSADFGFSSNLIDSVSSLPKPSAIAAKDLSTLLHSMGLTKYIGEQKMVIVPITSCFFGGNEYSVISMK